MFLLKEFYLAIVDILKGIQDKNSVEYFLLTKFSVLIAAD